MTLLPRPKLDAALAGLPRASLHGPWTRVVALKHLLGPSPDALYAKGAPAQGARYTPKGGMDSIYPASDPVTALTEVQAVFLHPPAPAFTIKTPPWTLIPVDVVTDVVDLCDPANRVALGMSFQELTQLARGGAPTGGVPAQSGGVGVRAAKLCRPRREVVAAVEEAPHRHPQAGERGRELRGQFGIVELARR